MAKTFLKRLNDVMTKYKRIAEQNPLLLRQRIPAKEIWRFFCDRIDLSMSDKDIRDYEKRERGYFESCIRAFNEACDYSIPISSGLVKRLHFLSMKDIADTPYANNDLKPGEFISTGTHFVSYRLILGDVYNASLQGLKDYNDKHQFIDDPMWLCLMFKQDNNHVIVPLTGELIELLRRNKNQFISLDRKEKFKKFLPYLYQHEYFSIDRSKFSFYSKKEILDQLLDNEMVVNRLMQIFTKLSKTDSVEEISQIEYEILEKAEKNDDFYLIASTSFNNKNIKQTSEDRENDFKNYLLYRKKAESGDDLLDQLRRIVDMVQNLTQQHALGDGNIRTYVMLFMQNLLTRNGFPFSLIIDPNRFDMCSRDELCGDVITGMEDVFELIEKSKLDNVDTDKMLGCFSEEEQAYFNKVIKIEMDNRIRVNMGEQLGLLKDDYITSPVSESISEEFELSEEDSVEDYSESSEVLEPPYKRRRRD